MLDYLNITDLLNDDERLIQSTVRDFLDREIAPHIEHWWNEGIFPEDTMQKLGSMGLLGSNLPEQYGGAGVSNVAYGVMMYEIERIDSGLRSAASVQGALVMYPIYAFGSEEQKQKYLPELASGRMIGCFGLTEPDGGSDPGAMRTRARLEGDEYVLNGNKMWITNSPVADIAVVWAKDDHDTIRGFIVPTDAKGFSAPKITSKMSLRASTTGEIVLEEVRIPRENLLPLSGGLKSPLMCLTQARYGIAWGALGALETVYTTALEYAKTRTTFGKPIGSRQLIQDKLVHMLSEHQKGLLLALRLGQLKDQNRLKFGQVSMAKRNNVRVALEGARMAREILGGNGITTEYPVIRHMLNLETVDTYEGTHDIHTLIIGREITGLNALE